MGRYVRANCRLCRTERNKLFLKGDRCRSDKCPIHKKKNAPGKGPRVRSKKMSNYGVQLREKQKLKRIYGMLEKQFKIFFMRASRMKGVTGDNLFALLERRLDNMVYRMRFATSRKQARQVVLHGHVRVNNKRVNVPSYLVKENDLIQIKEKSRNLTVVKEGLKQFTASGVMPWLEVDPDQVCGKVKAVPRRSDITDMKDINEQLIVELYSK
ncbi:MAG: 30S ribosomal protein S4 [Spirochaetaceae bacterium]|nr:MAG: 30S ribosomal protein S4 [Spirochaetaceae bacterium]